MRQRSIALRHYFLKDINPVVRFLILSDTVILGAAGLLGPIFALFVEDFIQGGDEAVAGIAAGIYLFSRSILQVPIAYYIDKIRGEKDDFWLMFIFDILIALIPITYLFINTPLELYAVQFLLGLFTAFTFPSYMAIFTRHIDREREGMEWGIYYSLTGLTGAGVAIVGGYIAATSGFPTLILVMVFWSLLGSLMLWPIKPYIRMKR